MTMKGEGKPTGSGAQTKNGATKSETTKGRKEELNSEDVQVIGVKNDQKLTNQKGIDQYWNKVKNGVSGAIVKIKQEKVEHGDNSYNILGEDENKNNTVENENNDVESDDEDDIYGDDTFEEEEDITRFPELAKQALFEVKDRNVDEMEHHELAETMFCVMRVKNRKLTRAQAYKQTTVWLKKALKRKLNEYLIEEFVKKVELLTKEIKELDVDDYDNDKEMERLVLDVFNISQMDAKGFSHMEIKEKFHEIKETILLIDDYSKDPLTMIPKGMPKIRECMRKDIDIWHYFQIVMAVSYEKGEVGETRKMSYEQLYHKAVDLWNLYSNESKKENINAVKKAKMSPAKKSTLEQKMEERKADLQEQAKNMDGINIDKLTPDESSDGFNFSIKSPPKKNDKSRQVKTIYTLHNRIHVDRNVNAQKVVQMVLKVLRKADPSVLILPYETTGSQNSFIEHEENVPEEENEIKKWISVADRQPYNKFVFNMKISITESPEVVKNRIFDWCRGQQHFMEFKKIDSANVFAAGWLYHLHPHQYNRDMLREWMVRKNEALQDHIHLAPAQLFKDKNDKKQAKIKGIRVEVAFEKKEMIMKELYALKWNEGPYKDAQFIPFRANESYTHEMQIQFLEKHEAYINRAKQWVFRMKGAQWTIKNKKTGKMTTFKDWISKVTVNGKRILDSVEIGNNDYVRLLFQEQYLSDVRHIMRKLYATTEETFGKEKTDAMFCLDKSPEKNDIYELERNHAEMLAKVLQGNPQNDDDDVIPTASPVKRQKINKVYFGTAHVDKSYASIAKDASFTKKSHKSENESINKNNNKGSNKEVNLKQIKEELLKEVTARVDHKIDNVERKMEKKLNTMKMENDTKIESLTELVKSNQTQMEANLKEQFKNNNAELVAQLSNLLGIQNKSNPPNDSVEQSSQSGGKH